jgi:three-Cys-motif partner protein
MEKMMVIKSEEFYVEQTEQSLIKSKIVGSYFSAWSRIMLNYWSDEISYIDLFCGPGRYQDGSTSTPLKLIEQTISNSDLSRRMRFVFNDIDHKNTSNLKKEILSL